MGPKNVITQISQRPYNLISILGIDVGTTSVKICLVDINSKEVLQKFVKDTLGNMPKDVPQADLQVRKFSILSTYLHGRENFEIIFSWNIAQRVFD